MLSDVSLKQPITLPPAKRLQMRMGDERNDVKASQRVCDERRWQTWDDGEGGCSAARFSSSVNVGERNRLLLDVLPLVGLFYYARCHIKNTDLNENANAGLVC